MPNMDDYHFEGSLKDNPRTKLQTLLNNFGPRKIGGLIATLVVAIMLPVTLIAMQQTQNVKQHASAQWRVVSNVPAGAIGVNAFGSVDDNGYFAPVLVEFSSSLHVFVIGEGKLRKDGSSTGKTPGDWYQLFVSSTNQPDIAWGPYRFLGGNASSVPEVKREGDSLRVRVRGLSIDGGGNMTPQYSTFYSKRRQLLADFPEGGSGWEVATDTSGWSYSNTATFGGKQYRAKTGDGRLVIEVYEEVSSQPQNTPVPTSRPINTPVPTTPWVTPSGYVSPPPGAIREFPTLTPTRMPTATPKPQGIACGRCSANYPGKWADFRTNDAVCTSSSSPIDGTVRYTENDPRCTASMVITNAGVSKSYNPWVVWATGTNLTSPLTVMLYDKTGAFWGYGSGVAYAADGKTISFSLPSNTPPGGGSISFQLMKGQVTSAKRTVSLQ